MHLRRGSTSLIPVLATFFSVAAFVLVMWFALPKHDATVKENANTTVISNTNLANTSPAETSNENTNLAEEIAPSYNSPTGPFTVSTAKILATAFRRSNDQLVTHLLKVDVTTGNTSTEASLRTPDIQAAAGLPALPNSPNLVRFGTDGDSIVFVANVSNPPAVGIYRTSFSDSTKIETLVQYDQNNLYNDDIPTISDLRFHAETNTVAFVIAGQADTDNNDLMVMNALDKHVRKLTSYPNAPALVGFPGNGAQVEVLWQDVQKNSDSPIGKWQMDQIRLSDDQVVKTTLVIDEGAVGQDVYLTGDNISPNNNLVGTSVYAKDQRKTSLWFRNLADGQVTALFPDGYYGGNFIWAPDSGKIVYQTNSTGILFDLAKAKVGEIKNFGSGVLWYPGPYLIYSDTSGDFYSYSISSGKSVKLADLNPSYGYGSGGLLGKDWVNR